MADSTSNIPRHGDNIISTGKDSLGGTKLFASPQFQRFLDELGRLFNDTGGGQNIEDITQELNASDATFSSKITQLRSAIENLVNSEQDILVNQANIGQILAKNRDLTKIVDANGQSLAILEHNLTVVVTELRATNLRVEELEQLIHVD